MKNIGIAEVPGGKKNRT